MSYERAAEWWRPASAAASVKKPLAGPPAESDNGWPFRALVLFTVILMLAPQQMFPVLMPLRIALLSIVLVVITHTAGRLSAGEKIIRISGGQRIALLLAGWTVLSVPFSAWPGGSVSFLLDIYFKTLIVYFLLANVVNSFARLRTISFVLVLITIPLAVTTVRNMTSGVFMEGGQRVVGYDAPLSENPNDMALLLNLILPFAIAFFLSTKSASHKLFFAAVIGLIVVAVMATFSRGGFLTLAVTFFVYMYLLRTRREGWLAPVILVFALMAIPFMPDSYIDRVSTITDIESDSTGSAQTRWRDTLAAVELVQAKPLMGAGVGMNMLAMNDVRGSTWTEIHNVYLSFAVELGIPGLVLFLVLLGVSLATVQRVLRERAHEPESYPLYCLAEAIKVSLIAFSIAAFFHPVAYHFYFYYIAGLAVAAATASDRQSCTETA